MTVVRITLPACPLCRRDAARLFERFHLGEVAYFTMCDPALRGCGACTDLATTTAGAADLWLTTDQGFLGSQRRVA